jgi:hypothetical protein
MRLHGDVDLEISKAHLRANSGTHRHSFGCATRAGIEVGDPGSSEPLHAILQDVETARAIESARSRR